MADESYLAQVTLNEGFEHYGTPHQGAVPHSGRYAWGSGEANEGKDPMTRSNGLLGQVARLKADGITNSTEIARALGMTTTEYRARYSVAYNQAEQAARSKALRLQKQGWGATAIGKELGRSESTVRGWLKEGGEVRKDIATQIAEQLKATIPENGAVDIGKSVELYMGTSADKLKVATQMLVDEGYEIHYMYEPQIGGAKGQKTTIKLLCAPGVDVKGPDGLYANRDRIKFVARDIDDTAAGESLGLHPPVSISSKRVKIIYAEDTFAGAKGVERDGVMLVNPNAVDLRLPNGHRYAQVRIGVDGTHYLKGMVAYGDPKDFPNGVDIAFCTNKHKGTPKMDVLKKMQTTKGEDGMEVIDTENPFKAAYRQFDYTDPKTGKRKQSALNVVNEEGDWDGWAKNLPSQMLSKQETKFAEQQLGISLDRTRLDYNEIKSLTNPVVKAKLLQEFADECDSSAVSLKAAAVPGQKTHVILPINSLKSNEIYAPNYPSGTEVVLVRFPHGGRFEMPALKVNNRNKEGLKYIGPNSKDAVGINAKVAEVLSGADFDGDTVLVIPNKKGQIKTAAPLAGLKGFDPKETYALPKDIDPKDKRLITARGKQTEMGKVSNLITDMTLHNATPQELARAVRHSMVVIDSEKHKLDYKRSYEENAIEALKEKYQGRNARGQLSGASTLISRAGASTQVLERKVRSMAEGGPIDPETGKKVYVNTGSTYKKAVRKNGVTTYVDEPRYVKSKRLAETDDAFTLSSGTAMESIYARYSNSMKALANQARLEYTKTKPFKVDPEAKKKYASNVKSMVAQLNEAKMNQPLERKALLIANQRMRTIREAHPEYDQDDLKKASQKEVRRARQIMGIEHKTVKLTDTDWEAIQAHAVSANRLSEILRYSDPDRIRELATPKQKTKLPSWSIARARALMNMGYTNQEVADALGISVATLNENVG